MARKGPKQKKHASSHLARRKLDHIKLCAEENVEAQGRFTAFSLVELRPKALPELNWDDLDTTTTFLGRSFAAPLMITGMTGGVEKGALINSRLAHAASELSIPMGVGSQRVALKDPKAAQTFQMKKKYPQLFLIGNIGIGQLTGPNARQIAQDAIDMIGADALAIHVNILQELVQTEGDRVFRGLIDSLGSLAAQLKVPLLVKEVGAGFDLDTATKLKKVGIRAVDVGGRGGTSWGYIEGLRAAAKEDRQVGETFRDWGIPTAIAVASLRQALPNLEIAATGGIRDGLTVAKAVGLGANICGIGLPLLRAALESEEAPFQELKRLIKELRIAMICAGCSHLDELGERLWTHSPFVSLLQGFTGSHDARPN